MMIRNIVFKLVLFATLTMGFSFQMNQMNITTAGTTTKDEPTTAAVQPSTADEPVTTAQVPTTSLTPEQECSKLNGTHCEGCVKNPKCLFCETDNTCKAYPVGHILPRTEDCAGGLSDARWGQCWINFQALIIAMGSIGGAIILAITVCICCCCCRSKKSNKYDRQEAKLERQKEERSLKSNERRQARQARNDEIRQKYGLVKEDNPYQRFDA